MLKKGVKGGEPRNFRGLIYDSKISTLQTLQMCMDVSLRLAHPFMPFITEVTYPLIMQKYQINNNCGCM